MAAIDYRYFVRGHWVGPADEKPSVTGAKFLKTLDSMTGIDPLFSDWQINRNWKLTEDEQPRFIPLTDARNRIAEIVESGIAHDDFDEPAPGNGYSVLATAGARGPRRVTFTARTGNQFFDLSFGEHNAAFDLTLVTYPLFRAALLAISAACDAPWAYAQARRTDMIKVPIKFGSGVPGYRIDSTSQVPFDPSFPKSIFHVPWIIYLSEQSATGLTLNPEILTERTPSGGLLMCATTERLDPANPEHARRARILAEIMIACTGYHPGGGAHLTAS